MQIKYKFVDTAWKRAQTGTEHGDFDGFFMASRNIVRDAYAVPSSPLIESEWYYIAPNKISTTPISDNFYQLSFGANQGTARLQWLINQKNRGKFKGDIMYGSLAENAWKMLQYGRFDVLLENKENLVRLFKDGALQEKNYKVHLARKISLSVYFGKKFLAQSPGFIDQFNAQSKNCLSG